MLKNSKLCGSVVVLGALLFSGCADKELAKEMALLRKETAESKVEREAFVVELKAEIANAKAENKKLAEKYDTLVDSLPMNEIREWKTAGKIKCKDLNINDGISQGSSIIANSSGILIYGENKYSTMTASGMGAFYGDNKAVVAVADDSSCVITEAKGFRTLMSSENGKSRIETLGSNSNYAGLVSTENMSVLKVCPKDDKKQAGLISMNDEVSILVSADAGHASVLNQASLQFQKRDQRVLAIGQAGDRGGSLVIYDDVGKEPKIIAALNSENGEPAVIVSGATKRNGLLPTVEKQ